MHPASEPSWKHLLQWHPFLLELLMSAFKEAWLHQEISMVNETGRRGNKSKEECHSRGDDQNTNTALVYRGVIARQMGGHLRPVAGKGDRERECQSNHKMAAYFPR